MPPGEKPATYPATVCDGPATDKIRAGGQSQDCQCTRPDGPACDPRPRRRVHRMNDRFAELERVALTNLETWIRRRLRSYLWRQWQNGPNRFNELRRRGVPKFRAAVAAGSCKSHVAAAPICGHDRGPRRLIDRLLKSQNPLENRNNLGSSSPHPGPGQTSGEPRRNFGVSTRETRLFRSPVFGSGIRRLDGEAVGGRRLARTRLKASRAGQRLR